MHLYRLFVSNHFIFSLYVLNYCSKIVRHYVGDSARYEKVVSMANRQDKKTKHVFDAAIHIRTIALIEVGLHLEEKKKSFYAWISVVFSHLHSAP